MFLSHRSSSFSNLTDQHALAVGVKMYTRAHYLFPEQAKCNLLVRGGDCGAGALVPAVVGVDGHRLLTHVYTYVVVWY